MSPSRPPKNVKLKKVLVANRGEIAVRVIRTLRVMGISSVAVYSDADENSIHVRLADEAVHLGASPPAASYLSGERIIQAARERGAEGVHPGYGFLAENSEFAGAVEKAGLTFVGPTPANMSELGNKVASRDALREAGIPPVPGSGSAVTKSRARRLPEEIGLPLLLKAAAGGGGKGIRIVRKKKELTKAFESAASEAQSSFGSSDLIAERYLERARHVEIQVLGDGAGGVQLFFERDCSTQRRLQKLLEETPSPAVTSPLRERLLLTAGRAMSKARYRGAGTLEFLLSEEGELFFLEMNTRIQVEHPVTEVTTGIDLIAEQIAIAEGKRFAVWKNDLSTSVAEPRGTAMEFRLNAEDPERDFQPSIGKLTALHLPFGPRIRVDSGVEAGDEITPYYDSLLAKVIAWGPSRSETLKTLSGALKETRVHGVMSTAPLGIAVLADKVFVDGKNHCQYMAERLEDGKFLAREHAEEDLPLIAAAAAWLHRQNSHSTGTKAPVEKGAGGDLSPWALLQRGELREGMRGAR